MTEYAQHNETGRGSWRAAIQACTATTPTDRRNRRSFIIWALLWAFAFIAASFALRPDMGLEGAAAWVVAIAPNVFIVAAVLAYVRYLYQADEFVRKVQTEILAIGLGTGLVLVLGYAPLEMAGAPALPDAASVMAMTGGMLLGHFISAWRYR